MNKFLKILFFLFSVGLLAYVILPSPAFPNPPEAVVQSDEPADLESPLRRGYFTNLTRSEIIAHYQTEFNKPKNFYTLRLNYPPEESQTIIRDQTKSTFLEELTHPLRESLFVSGFESEGTIYEFKVDGEVWAQKIIIKYVPSSIYIRLLVVTLTLASVYLLMREYFYVKE
ncbi:hypothetical protein ISR94_02300 [Candidatus Microgenomates bacterium]|nr:hypothetical protein [Candidatus Microgenomates bacterium]